jgi:hypothetical protein
MHAPRMGKINTGFWWVNPQERDNLEDVDVDGKIIFETYPKKEGCCEQGNEHSNSIICARFLDSLRVC